MRTSYGFPQVPSVGTRGRAWLIALVALSELAVVAVAHHSDVSFGASYVGALALAPFASMAVALITRRVGPRTAIAAGVVYAALPFAGRLYFYGAFLKVYDREVMPSLVGLEHTGWFAVGVVVAVAVGLAPERASGIASLVTVAVAAVAWIDVSWSGLYGDFHETTWSPTLLCYLPLAGVIGLATRRPWLAAAIGGWFGVLLLRGVHKPYYEGGLWLSLAAATPAIAVLLTSLALLVPPLPSLRRRSLGQTG